MQRSQEEGVWLKTLSLQDTGGRVWGREAATGCVGALRCLRPRACCDAGALPACRSAACDHGSLTLLIIAATDGQICLVFRGS